MELALLSVVPKPVESHVDGFGSILPHGRADDAVGCYVIRGDWSRRLGMTNFFEWRTCHSCKHLEFWLGYIQDSIRTKMYIN